MSARAFLESLPPSSIRLGLERVREALAKLDHPELGRPVLQIAGTNGKGSTAAFAAECLRRAGHRVGLYTSPHLESFNERIRVDGEPIPDAVLETRLRAVLDRLGAAPSVSAEAQGDPFALSYFELATVLALWHFREEAVDVLVLEVGLGGRLDATSAAPATVCAITPIGLDHTEWLGESLVEIAAEKAAILRPGAIGIVAHQRPEVVDLIGRLGLARGATLRFEDQDFALEPSLEAGELGDVVAREHPEGLGAAAASARPLTYTDPTVRWEGLSLGLEGAHQRTNAAVAIAALRALDETGLKVPEAAIREGLRDTRWPGRLERFALPLELSPSAVPVSGKRGTGAGALAKLPHAASGPELVIDGAHNPDGVRALVDTLGEAHPGERWHGVFGALADKHVEEMLRLLLPLLTSLELVPLPSPRALGAERLLAIASGAASREGWRIALRTGASVGDGLRRAHACAVRSREGATERGGRGELRSDAGGRAVEGGRSAARILCAGSLVLAGEARRWAREVLRDAGPTL